MENIIVIVKRFAKYSVLVLLNVKLWRNTYVICQYLTAKYYTRSWIMIGS